MEGRLYPDSTSIYQDEAKTLFNFFSVAADKIIKEENDKQSVINDLNAQIGKVNKQRIIIPSVVLVLAVVSGILSQKILAAVSILAVAVVCFVVFQVKLNKLNSSLALAKKAYDGIRRNYSVGKMGVAYVPVAKKIPFEDKSITIDLSGTVPLENFNLMSIENPERLNEDIESLRGHLSSIPIVDKSSNEVADTSDMSLSMQQVPVPDYSKKLQDDASAISSELNNVKTVSVDLPVIEPNSQNMEFLKNCGTSNPEEYPVLDVFSIDGLKDELDVFHEMYKQYEIEQGTGDVKAMEDLLLLLGESNQIISRNKVGCTSAILEYNNNIFANVLKSSSLNFSPRIEAENIDNLKNMTFNFADLVDSYQPIKFKESSKMHFDLFSNSWIDNLNNHTSVPYSLNQIQEEIFMPMILSLMEENRIERRKLYDDVQKEKMKYLNEWQKETQDFYGRNRDTADAIKTDIVKTLAQYNSAYASYKSLENTINQLDTQTGKVTFKQSEEASEENILLSAATVNEKFENQQRDFNEYMERILDDIEDKAAKFGYINYYEASLYADDAQKTAVAMSSIGNLEQREKRLAMVNPYLAVNGKLPPEPSVEQNAIDLVQMDLFEESKKIITANRDLSNDTPYGEEDEKYNGGVFATSDSDAQEKSEDEESDSEVFDANGSDELIEGVDKKHNDETFASADGEGLSNPESNVEMIASGDESEEFEEEASDETETDVVEDFGNDSTAEDDEFSDNPEDESEDETEAQTDDESGDDSSDES